MNDRQVFFKNKKILIYGFGKSGISCYNFLKKNLPKNILPAYDGMRLKI